MTDASGVPTNPDLIPTFNTSVDAPSGLGFNTAMAQLQAIITNLKAGTLASGKILPAGIGWTGAYPFVNADVAAAAALAVSKLAPGANGQFMQTTGGVAVWGAGPSNTTYRKVTATAVNTSVAETDLLAGAITVAANAMGATGLLRLTAWGNILNNTGASQTGNRWKLKLGATTIIDTGAPAATFMGASATRADWCFSATILNSATNIQAVGFNLRGAQGAGGSANLVPTALTTGNGVYVSYSNPGSGVGYEVMADNTAAVDTTAGQALVFSVINPSALATYETKLLGALVEII